MLSSMRIRGPVLRAPVLILIASLAAPSAAFAGAAGAEGAPPAASTAAGPEGREAGKDRIAFASFAEAADSLEHTLYLAESIRTFGGELKGAPIRIYAPKALIEAQPDLVGRIKALGVEVRSSEAPADALPFPFARKVFAAAEAEEEAKTEILAWMDEDTIVLQEPRDLLLPKGISLGYRPVTHQRIGSLFDAPPDEFWSRVYEKLSVPESAIFPVITPADAVKLRAYFNAGLLPVRPERGTLRRWARDFSTLYRDPVFVEWCRQDRFKLIFLHQAALVGAVLGSLKREEMIGLDQRYNFPLFFKEMYGARREFDSIADVVTLRYDVYFNDPAPDWADRLKGPPAKIAWLRERLGKKR